jgi:hypothetical protein
MLVGSVGAALESLMGSGRFGATKLTPVEVTTDQAPVYPAVLEEPLTSGLASHRPVCQ